MDDSGDPRGHVKIGVMNAFDACQLALERYRNFARWRNLWTILLFVLGASVVLSLLAAIFLFIRAEWLPVALSTLGTIVTGLAAKWVMDRRVEAVREEQVAYEDAQKSCSNGEPAQARSQVDNQLKLFGSVR
jgi:MFS superfamily sulfate permease-like transporter